ncbi:unnamed protein product, partial [marine sediment metagenome]
MPKQWHPETSPAGVKHYKRSGGEHTPGPWERLDNHVIGGRAMGNTVAVIPSFGPGDSVAVANARLIAATPDLLEAAELAGATIERLSGERRPGQFSSVKGTLDVLRAAIAR